MLLYPWLRFKIKTVGGPSHVRCCTFLTLLHLCHIRKQLTCCSAPVWLASRPYRPQACMFHTSAGCSDLPSLLLVHGLHIHNMLKRCSAAASIRFAIPEHANIVLRCCFYLFCALGIVSLGNMHHVHFGDGKTVAIICWENWQATEQARAQKSMRELALFLTQVSCKGSQATGNASLFLIGFED